MEIPTTNIVDKPILLLVEGSDEEHICNVLLRKKMPNYSDCIKVENAQGGNDLWEQAHNLDVRSGFVKALKTLAILCDAEENPQKTAKRWRTFEAEFIQKYPNKTCKVLILPSDTEAGAIENIFVNSLNLSTTPIAQCAANFIACVDKRGSQTTQARRDKLMLTSYINAHTKNPYSRIGMAIEQGAKDLFDFEHESFKPLIEFLNTLCTNQIQ